MTFEDSIDLLIERGFYLQRACSHFGLSKFHVIIGMKTRLYAGGGDTLSKALTEAMDNYEKGETWPPLKNRHTSSHKELDDTLKDLGIDLD